MSEKGSSAKLFTKLNLKEDKAEHFGCYNQDLSLLDSRLPDYSNALSIKNKKVTIIGCGSSGSYVAEELVKSGVTNFILIDDDYLAVENVLRHACNLSDIGLKKIHALKAKLLKINPYIQVVCLNEKINIIPNYVGEKIKNSDIIINATADIEEVINEFCWCHKIPSVYSKVYPLGFGGEIIRVIPNVTPCFECLHNEFTNVLEEHPDFTNFPPENIKNYNETLEGEILSTPALSIDAKFISLFAAKMTLEILYSNSLDEFKLKPNIILWGNEKKWIFEQDFECIKVNTSNFVSCNNCVVCFGIKQIESELGLTEEKIIVFANNIKIKNVED